MENHSNSTSQSGSKNTVFIVIIIALAALSAYLFFQKNKTEDNNEDLTSQVETATADLSELETEYNAALARLDEMKSQNRQVDSLLSTKSEEVEALKAKIRTILQDKNADAEKMKEATRLITELNSKINSYEQQIVALKQENIQLTEDKRQLLEEKSQLSQEREQLNEEKNKLEKKVEEGSVLSASNIKMTTINQKKNLLGKEVEKETGKAKKADLIRIAFDLNDNRISESGEKIIFIAITGPDGKQYGNSNFSTVDGEMKKYAASKVVPYRRGEKAYGVTLDWKPSDDFAAGNYRVELFHMGYKIGSERVDLR